MSSNKSKKSELVTVTMKMPREERERLRELAGAFDTSMGWLVMRAMDSLEKNEMSE